MLRNIYLLFCVIGAVFPGLVLLPWLVSHNFDLLLMFNDIVTSPVALFAWLDALFAALVLFIFIYNDSRKRKIKLAWLAVLGTLGLGVSFGLPLYLFLREWVKQTGGGLDIPRRHAIAEDGRRRFK